MLGGQDAQISALSLNADMQSGGAACSWNWYVPAIIPPVCGAVTCEQQTGCRAGVPAGESWTAAARRRTRQCLAVCADSRCLPVCSCISVGAAAALCVQPRGLPVRASVRLQPGQRRHCPAAGFQNAGDLWEEGRTWASKVHLRGVSYTSLLPHITHPKRIAQQRSSAFCFVHFVLRAGYLCHTLSLVLPGTCVVPHYPPEERGKGNVSSSTEISTPLGLKGQPRNQLNLETIC